MGKLWWLPFTIPAAITLLVAAVFTWWLPRRDRIIDALRTENKAYQDTLYDLRAEILDLRRRNRDLERSLKALLDRNGGEDEDV